MDPSELKNNLFYLNDHNSNPSSLNWERLKWIVAQMLWKDASEIDDKIMQLFFRKKYEVSQVLKDLRTSQKNWEINVWNGIKTVSYKERQRILLQFREDPRFAGLTDETLMEDIDLARVLLFSDRIYLIDIFAVRALRLLRQRMKHEMNPQLLYTDDNKMTRLTPEQEIAARRKKDADARYHNRRAKKSWR